ncbi:WD40-like protein [Arachis hypogaea]|nr:WD40-like protein [Arachis hypogaea]
MQYFIEYLGVALKQKKSGVAMHRLRLEKYKRDLHSLQKKRKNLQAVWSPEGKLITIPEC